MVRKPWSLTARGISLTIRLTPKGGRDAIDGIGVLPDGRPILKLRVRAAASDGEANSALIRLIATAMDVPQRAVILAAGPTGRARDFGRWPNTDCGAGENHNAALRLV